MTGLISVTDGKDGTSHEDETFLVPDNDMMIDNCSDVDRSKTPSSTSPSESSSSSDDIPKIHSLVLVQNDQCLIGKRNKKASGVTTLDLSQGENWLQLPHRTMNDDLDDGSDIDYDLNDNIPTILSSTASISNNNNTTQPQEFWLLSATEPSVLDENLVGCFLCLDVDESYLTIKDMRTPQQHSEADDGSEWVVSIGRNGQKKNVKKNSNEIIVQEKDDFRIKSSAKQSAILSTQFNEETFLLTSSMEELPRRQLRILYQNDIIVLKRQKTCFENNVTETNVLHKMILQCQYDVSIDRHRRRVPESGLIELQSHDEDSDRKISFSDANNMQKYGYIDKDIKQLSKDDSLSLECESKDNDDDDGVLDSKEHTKNVSAVVKPPAQDIEKLVSQADNLILEPRDSALHVNGQLVVEYEERNENSGESSGSEGDRPTPYATICSSAAISSVDDETPNGGLGGLLTQPMSSQSSHDSSENTTKAVIERDVLYSDTNELIVVEEMKTDIKNEEKEDDDHVGDDDSTIDPDDEPLETFAKRVSISSKLIRCSNSVSDHENQGGDHLETHEDEKLKSASKLDTSDISRNENIVKVGSDATSVSNRIHASNELKDMQSIKNPVLNKIGMVPLSSDVPTDATALGNQVARQKDLVVSRRENYDSEESENILAMLTPPSVKAKHRKSGARNSSPVGNDPDPDCYNDQNEMYSECLLSQAEQLTPDAKGTVAFADISTKQELKQQASLQNSSALQENTLEVSKCDIDCSEIGNNQLQTDTDVTELESTNAKDAGKEANLNIDEQLAFESECSYFPLMTQAPESMQLEEDTNENSESNQIAVNGGTSSPLSEEIQVLPKITKTEQVAACNDKDLERGTLNGAICASPISDPKASSFDEAKKEGIDCNDQPKDERITQPLDEGLVGQGIDQIETGSKLSKRLDFDVAQEDPESSCTIVIVPVDPENATKMMESISNDTDGGHEVPSVSYAEAVNADALRVHNAETDINSNVGLDHKDIASTVEVSNRGIGVADEPIMAVDLESATKMMESISNEVPSVSNTETVDADAQIVDNAETNTNTNVELDHIGIVSKVDVSNIAIGEGDEPIVSVDLESATKMMESVSNEIDGGHEVPSVSNAETVDADAQIVDSAETNTNTNVELDHKGIVSTVDVSNIDIGEGDEPIVAVDLESATKMTESISNEIDGGHEVPAVSNAEAVNADALIVDNAEAAINSNVGLDHNGIVSTVEVSNRDIGKVDEPIVPVDPESATKTTESISNETDGGHEVPSVPNAEAANADALIVDNAEVDINSNVGLDHKGIVSTVEVSIREIGVVDEDSSRGHALPLSLEVNNENPNLIAEERLDNETLLTTESNGLTLDAFEGGNQKIRVNIPFQVLNTDYSIINRSDDAGNISHENCSIDISTDIGMTVIPSSDKFACVETHEARTDQSLILSTLNHANESKENCIPHENDVPSADINSNIDVTVLSSSDIETHGITTESEVKEMSHENCIPSADSNIDIGVVVTTSSDKDESHVARTDHSLLSLAVNRTNDTEVKNNNNITPKNVKALTKKVHKRKVISSDVDSNVESMVSSSSVSKRNKRSTRVKEEKGDESKSNRNDALTSLPGAISDPTLNTVKRSATKRKVDNTIVSVGSIESPRKRSRQTSETVKSVQSPPLEDCTKSEEVRLVVTGLELTQAQKKMLKKINGTLLENVDHAHTATHAIVTDGSVPIRRTPKLMIALCCTPNIISSDWLLQSCNAGKALKTDKFLVLEDEKAEKQYNFSLRKTISRINTNAKIEKHLLDGWSVYVCNGVAGNKSPPEKELRLIVEAAGGKWLASLSSKSSVASSKNTIIITSDPESKKQISSKDVVAALKSGAHKKTTAWLFHSMMTQDLVL